METVFDLGKAPSILMRTISFFLSYDCHFLMFGKGNISRMFMFSISNLVWSVIVQELLEILCETLLRAESEFGELGSALGFFTASLPTKLSSHNFFCSSKIFFRICSHFFDLLIFLALSWSARERFTLSFILIFLSFCFNVIRLLL